MSYRTDEVVSKSESEKEGRKEIAEAKKKAKADKKAEKKAKKEGGNEENVNENETKEQITINQETNIPQDVSCCNRDFFPKDEWDDEDFTWEEVKKNIIIL